MKRFFYCQEKGSNKFWNIEIETNRLIVCFGKVGTAGRNNIKVFENRDLAAKEAEKLIKEKSRKGYRELSENDFIPCKQEMPPKPMNEDLFWEIIHMLDWRKEGNDEAVIKPALKFLATRSVEDIFFFDDILSKKLYDLDGPAWGECVKLVSGGYLSSDEFLYTRCCVVANGQDFYETVLRDPNQIRGDLEFESLLYIAKDAWSQKVEQDVQDYPHETEFDFESFSNTTNWSPTVES